MTAPVDFKPEPGYLYTATEPFGIPNPPSPKINISGSPPYNWGQGVKVRTAPVVFRLFNDKNPYKVSRCPYCWLADHEHSLHDGHRSTHCPTRHDFGSEAEYSKHLKKVNEAKGVNFKHHGREVMIDGKWYHERDGHFVITIL